MSTPHPPSSGTFAQHLDPFSDRLVQRDRRQAALRRNAGRARTRGEADADPDTKEG